MGGCNATYGTTVDANFSLHSQSIDEELHHSLRIELLLIWSQVWRENLLLRLPISTIVPNEDVAVTTKEEIEPIGIGLRDHPLVYEGIWIAHYDC